MTCAVQTSFKEVHTARTGSGSHQRLLRYARFGQNQEIARVAEERIVIQRMPLEPLPCSLDSFGFPGQQQLQWTLLTWSFPRHCKRKLEYV
jgi:hypothetical protein